MRLKSGLACAMITLSAVGVTANANADLRQCNSGNACMWGNNDYHWLIAERPGGQGRYINFGRQERNDEMDSWANKSGFYGCWYEDANGRGGRNRMDARDRDNNMAPWDSDEASSWRTRFGC